MNNELSAKEFSDAFKFVPRLAIDLIIIKDGQILLAKRGIEPQKGFWHFPGSFLKKGELIDKCIARILKDEIGLGSVKFNKELDHVDDSPTQDQRGHVVAIRYKILLNNYDISPTMQNEDVRFFSELPKDIGFDHRKILSRLGFN